MDGTAGSGQVRLAIVEVLDRDGHARQVVPIERWPVTIGRAIDCDVVLDDPFVAARHATIDEVNGALSLHVGTTLNGVQLGHRHLKSEERAELHTEDLFQLGATRLRVRRASDVVEPERQMTHEHAPSFLLLAALVVAFIAANLAERWIGVDPGGRTIDYLPALLGPLLLVAIWCGIWSLGSRLFRHRFDYGRHLGIATSYSVGASLVAVLLPVLAYALGWAFLSRISGIAVAGVVWAMVLAHLTVVLPARRRFLAVGMSVLFVAGVALYLTRNYQTNHRLFSELYVTTLAPPVLRMASPVPTSRFIDEARDLKSSLDAHVHDDDNAGSADDDEE